MYSTLVVYETLKQGKAGVHVIAMIPTITQYLRRIAAWSNVRCALMHTSEHSACLTKNWKWMSALAIVSNLDDCGVHDR